MTWMLFLLSLNQGSYVTQVREGYLDGNEFARIGLVFEHYQYFETFSWAEVRHRDGHMVVTFDGIIPDEKAVSDYYKQHQYSFRLSFKAIQLEPYYGLNDDKQKLRYRIHFSFQKDGSFKVRSGSLGRLDQTATWHDKELEAKSLDALISGIYANENPYVSLIKGLPFK